MATGQPKGILESIMSYSNGFYSYRDLQFGEGVFKVDFGPFKQGQKFESGRLNVAVSELSIVPQGGGPPIECRVKLAPHIETPAFGPATSKPCKLEMDAVFEIIKRAGWDGKKPKVRVVFGSPDPDIAPQPPMVGELSAATSEAIVISCEYGEVPLHPQFLGLAPNSDGQWNQLNKLEVAAEWMG